MGGTRIYNAPVVTRDAVSLATDVYLPPVAVDGTPVRTIVGRTPVASVMATSVADLSPAMPER